MIASEKGAAKDGHLEHLFHVKSLDRLFVVVVRCEILEVLKEFILPLVKVVKP